MSRFSLPRSFDSAPPGRREAGVPRQDGLKLARYPDAGLRAVSEPVEQFDSRLRDLLQEMFALLRAVAGLSLTASQVGVRRRVLIGRIAGRSLCLVNPEIQAACEPATREETCLSLPGIRVRVERPERLRVTGYDARGRRTAFGATGEWARLIQHGVDHLNGVLICDYARPEQRECRRCRLALPPVLVAERKHYLPSLHPSRNRKSGKEKSRSAPRPMA